MGALRSFETLPSQPRLARRRVVVVDGLPPHPHAPHTPPRARFAMLSRISSRVAVRVPSQCAAATRRCPTLPLAARSFTTSRPTCSESNNDAPKEDASTVKKAEEPKWLILAKLAGGVVGIYRTSTQTRCTF